MFFFTILLLSASNKHQLRAIDNKIGPIWLWNLNTLPEILLHDFLKLNEQSLFFCIIKFPEYFFIFIAIGFDDVLVVLVLLE
jgi:hypothetical protein